MATFQPLSKFYLIKDVDIDVSYTHQYYFDTIQEQYNFFTNKVFKTVTEGTYQRKNSNVLAVPFQADEIRECKYLMWQNPNYSDKWYYAFVTHIDYANPNMSRIGYVLDVYQTYLFDMNWKQSYIERKHDKRYENGLPVVNMEEEGLDYGNTYVTLKKTNLIQIPDVSFLILGFTEDISQIGPGGPVIRGIPTQLNYYILPIYLGYPQKNFLLNNVSYTLTSAASFLYACANDPELVGKLVSVFITPFLTLGDLGYTIGDSNITLTSANLEVKSVETDRATYHLTKATDSATLQVYELSDTRTVYEDFPNYDESKLLMYPYSFTELTTERGDTYIIRNEQLITRNGPITIGVFGTINHNNRISYIVKNYLSSTRPYYMEQGIHDNSNANLPIIDDYTASYLQSNSNAIEVSRKNALLQQQSSMQIASNTNVTNVNNANKAMWANEIQIIGNSAAAMATAIGKGSITGGIGSAIQEVSSAVANVMQKDIALASAATNLENSRISASTNYQMSIASLNAKLQDAEQVPSTARSMGGDYLFDIAYMCDGIYLLKKTIQPYYVEKLTNYFKLYGYKVNKLEIPEFHTRENWNYIKMAEPIVEGNIPMNDLLKIRDIFIKGITLWHGDYIGNYSLNNKEV